ncbi:MULTISPECIES: hypothetical protein [unclassified Haladaptatus]|uniref:DUF7344 domain-containing protein n=1 Tax=unclassified Haladaptatus TaxID=2622732 RepID=UPI00209C31CE|nr:MULTISPECIES: hypothetical protein [unclassified Haladaptatus]MCO8246627.1 hypothetical protein [Haladaptatus sp. AB643]MCO8256249.1 hypothetical protein [Haladaptatus sp. AB618]
MPDEPEALYRILGDVGGQSEKRLSKTLAERQPESACLGDVADAIVRCKTETEPTEVQAERERIYVSLSHHHVPKSIDANLVSFDVSENRVAFRESDEVAIQEVLLER